jgi:hypothetical protein
MPNPQLLAYVRQNLQLNYSEEQIRNALITAGYNMRDIDDALDSVLHPQDLAQVQQAQPQKPEAVAQQNFLHKIPTWMIGAAVGGIFLLVVIIILLIPSGDAPSGLLSENGIKVSAYDFACAGPGSTLTITINNDGFETLSDIQLFVDDAFQQDQLVPSLEPDASGTYSYSGIDCTEWVQGKTIKIVSDKAVVEGPIDFKCTSGACSG